MLAADLDLQDSEPTRSVALVQSACLELPLLDPRVALKPSRTPALHLAAHGVPASRPRSTCQKARLVACLFSLVARSGTPSARLSATAFATAISRAPSRHSAEARRHRREVRPL